MTQLYLRMKTVPLLEVLPILRKHLGSGAKAKIRENVAGVDVKVSGVRLQTFASKGCTCSACGLKASYFAIESNDGKGTGWHLNLWGEKDGEPVLFTHDHTLARSAGGADNMSNTTTMCSPCNALKSIADRIEALAYKEKQK